MPRHFAVRPLSAALVALIAIAFGSVALALTTEDLDPGKQWKVGTISFSGNNVLSGDDLKSVLHTRERPFYQFWKKRPEFDPGVFDQDLHRLTLFYQTSGYYNAEIACDLETRGELVNAKITVKENKPVHVEEIHVSIDGYSPPENQPPVNKVPLKRGDIFNQRLYQSGEQILRLFFVDAGFARAKAERRAEVDVVRDSAKVWYTVRVGDKAFFGTTRISGIRKVNPKIVKRELTYKEGEEYSNQQIEQSRTNLLNLHLFSAVRFNPQLESQAPEIPLDLNVREKPQHSIRIGAGYSTMDDFGGQVQWSDYNWGGDGRQLSAVLRYGRINSFGDISLTQPYLLGDRDFQGVLEAAYVQQTWQTYTLRSEQFKPRLMYHFTDQLTGTLGYQVMYAQLNSVNPSVIQELGGIVRKGILHGPTMGLVWNTTDDPYNPKHGGVVTFAAEMATRAWGSDYSYYRTTLDLRKYTLIAPKTVLATRIMFGIADSLGPRKEYPLFERFFPGGDGSVRGYGYWRLGPLSASNDPLGGLSLVQGSVELRHPISGKLGGAVFVDFGQTTIDPYRFPTPLRFGFGPAIMYDTPLGPLRLDLGIPSRAPRGDPWWQIYFSIGQFF